LFQSKFYPNPFDQKLIISFPQNIQKEMKIEISNVSGQKMTEYFIPLHSNQSKMDIQTENWPSGIYLIKFYTNDFQEIMKAVKFESSR
jgi:hypothetical protein